MQNTFLPWVRVWNLTQSEAERICRHCHLKCALMQLHQQLCCPLRSDNEPNTENNVWSNSEIMYNIGCLAEQFDVCCLQNSQHCLRHTLQSANYLRKTLCLFFSSACHLSVICDAPTVKFCSSSGVQNNNVAFLLSRDH